MVARRSGERDFDKQRGPLPLQFAGVVKRKGHTASYTERRARGGRKTRNLLRPEQAAGLIFRFLPRGREGDERHQEQSIEYRLHEYPSSDLPETEHRDQSSEGRCSIRSMEIEFQRMPASRAVYRAV